MRGLAWQQWIADASGAPDLAQAWLSDLRGEIKSALPDSDVSSYAAIASTAGLNNGAVRAALAQASGESIGKLWTAIGDGVGVPISEGIEAFRPFAQALDFDRFTGFASAAADGVNWIPKLKSAVNSKPVGEVMLSLVQTGAKLLPAVAMGTAAVPIAGVVIAAFGAWFYWDASKALQKPEPQPCSGIESAEISRAADANAAQLVINEIGKNPLVSPPDLTPFFMPRGRDFRRFNVDLGGLARDLADVNCVSAWGSLPQASEGGGYVPGTDRIHVSFESIGGGYVDPGCFLPTAASLLSQIWVQVQTPGPLMFTINARAVRQAWIDYIVSAILAIPDSMDWGGNYRAGIQLFNELANVCGFAEFSTWYRDDESGFFGRERAAQTPFQTLSGLEYIKAIAETSIAVRSMDRLYSLQAQALKSRVMGYINNDFVGLRDTFPAGNGVFVRNETAQVIAQSGTRCGLDRDNIVDPALEAAVKSCPKLSALTTAIQSYATAPLAPTPGEVVPPTVWTPGGTLAALPESTTPTPAVALAALGAAAALFLVLRR